MVIYMKIILSSLLDVYQCKTIANNVRKLLSMSFKFSPWQIILYYTFVIKSHMGMHYCTLFCMDNLQCSNLIPSFYIHHLSLSIFLKNGQLL
jgi:hypothetical protein